MTRRCRDMHRVASMPRLRRAVRRIRPMTGVGAFALMCAVALALTACEREQRRFSEIAPASGRSDVVQTTEIQPSTAQPSASVRDAYEKNAPAVSEGKQLYQAYNCVGCHANGGGGMGPALMDGNWRYGGSVTQIYMSIVEGRPNGMPAFGSRIPAEQVSKLAAYVRSMSGQLTKDVSPSRSDHMNVKPAEQSMPRQTPVTAPPR